MGKIPDDYIERCYAGWLGKIIGVRHGAPIEGWSYEKINKLLGEIETYPVNYRDFAADDDSNGPLFFLQALNDYTYTRDITAEQIGMSWLNYAPYEHGFYWWGGYGKSTEHTAYLNLRSGIMAPRSGSVEQNGAAVAEQIGGQIFIDSWGLTVPAEPPLAPAYAGKAAGVEHGRNGINGGQVTASAISAAFVLRSVREVIEAALAVIPPDCEYARMTRDIMAFYDAHQGGCWRECMEYIIANWGYDRYPGACHIIPNSAVIVMSLLYGEGCFDRAINICNMAGWDTDCNVANVGSIMGVFVGLDGIDYAWRAPINDFLAASSVVGSMNIMNLPGCVRMMANLAYRIAGEEVPKKWASFLAADALFDFALPGSTCAFRLLDSPEAKEDTLCHDTRVYASGHGSLKVLLQQIDAGQDRRIYHRTYYRPEHFHDSRYDPSFSPILYPGQTVTARVMSDTAASLRACVYVLDGNTGTEYTGESKVLAKGEWADLELTIPALCGACIEQAGIKVTILSANERQALIYLDQMHFSGKADYTLDFSAERVEIWNSLHREVSQLTYLKGIWVLEDNMLSGSCGDYGEAYTGDISWRDLEMTCRFKPVTDGRCGFALRVQGAIRGYAVLLDSRGLSLVKNENGYRELARCAPPECNDGFYEITARVRGNQIALYQHEKLLLCVEDTDKPYLTGMAGFVVRDGGHAHYEKLKISVL